MVGLDEASGCVSVVGRIGDQINDSYRRALGVDRLKRTQVTGVLVDLKRRIQGDFFVVEETDGKVVLGNRACPFGDKVLGRPSLCMMTSNVFGAIAADNLGYAKVALEETIAQGHGPCRVTAYLRPDGEASAAEGREYYAALGAAARRLPAHGRPAAGSAGGWWRATGRSWRQTVPRSGCAASPPRPPPRRCPRCGDDAPERLAPLLHSALRTREFVPARWACALRGGPEGRPLGDVFVIVHEDTHATVESR